jgi:hypothetical protein
MKKEYLELHKKKINNIHSLYYEIANFINSVKDFNVLNDLEKVRYRFGDELDKFIVNQIRVSSQHDLTIYFPIRIFNVGDLTKFENSLNSCRRLTGSLIRIELYIQGIDDNMINSKAYLFEDGPDFSYSADLKKSDFLRISISQPANLFPELFTSLEDCIVYGRNVDRYNELFEQRSKLFNNSNSNYHILVNKIFKTESHINSLVEVLQDLKKQRNNIERNCPPIPSSIGYEMMEIRCLFPNGISYKDYKIRAKNKKKEPSLEGRWYTPPNPNPEPVNEGDLREMVAGIDPVININGEDHRFVVNAPDFGAEMNAEMQRGLEERRRALRNWQALAQGINIPNNI